MLELRDVGVAFDGTHVVHGVDLDLPEGNLLAVLGPSGCGKSTLLRAIAGLEPLASGTIRVDGADLAGVPTHRRGFALMFQDGQLFDHLTVAGNVGYAPALRGIRRAAVRRRSEELLAMVGLEGYADRMPRTLSGGERQRVALARSLAARPRLLLLDEPLSALDAELRVRMADDLAAILRESGTPALMVTHDQSEAFALADRLAVMRAGRIVQEGPTAEVWRAPVDAETALFLGFSQVVTGAAATALLALAGDRETTAAAVAVRSSAVHASPGGSGDAGLVRESRATPEGSRLRVAVEGIGTLDALGAPGWIAVPGDRTVVHVDRQGLAVLASG